MVKGDRNFENLLGYETALAMGVLKIINSVNTVPTVVDKLAGTYDSLFHGIGKMKDVKVKLHIDKTVEPVAQKHRRIPFHLRQKVDQELSRLLEAGIIETVNEPTDWVSPCFTCGYCSKK